MKKIIVCFICVSLIVLLCSCNTASMYASSDVEEYVEAKDGYLIQSSYVSAAGNYIDIDVAQLTIKCGKDIVDVCFNYEYDANYGYNSGVVRYYIARVDGIVYGIHYVSIYMDGEFYATTYSVYDDNDELFARIYGTIWTELNDYSAIDNMPRILEYFFITSSPEVNESGFTYTVDYADVGIDSGQHSDIFYETVAVYYNCLVEISVSDIGSTFVSTTSMPKEVRDFTNMVGEQVVIEGPAYNK